MILASSIDWTNVLVSLIVGAPAIIAALYSAKIHAQIKTPSGKPLGEVAEYTHDATIANNMLLSKSNGPTKSLGREAAHTAGQESPRFPDDDPPEAGEGDV